MRQLTVKYTGICSKCDKELEIGQQAMYEKTTGIFCIGCEPKDIEEIRYYRQIKADKKADRLEGWANKREQKASVQLNSYPSMRHDWAFITQPGHIPARARMIKSDDKAYESLNVAEGMRSRAESIRKVRVKGDAEREYQRKRDENDKIIKKGSIVKTAFITGEVTRINKKTYSIRNENSGTIWTQDKSWAELIK